MKVSTLNGKIISEILSHGYNATAKLGWMRGVYYAYPTSTMATRLGKAGYYVAITRHHNGKAESRYLPTVYMDYNAAWEEMRNGIYTCYLLTSSDCAKDPAIV